MNQSFIPTADSDFANFLSNLGTKLAPNAVTVGLVAADATAVSTDATSFQTLVVDQINKQTAAKGATTAKDLSRATIEKRTRALIKRIKSHPAYTATLGEQLGIAAPAGTAAPVRMMAQATAEARPTLRGLVAGDGSVGLKFKKHRHTGVMIFGRRGDETAFTLLAKQLFSPFIDDRENLVPGEPETREYYGLYVDGDQTVGQQSDVTRQTVPAKAKEPAPAPARAETTPAPAAKAA
jgi:hypothetical protein